MPWQIVKKVTPEQEEALQQAFATIEQDSQNENAREILDRASAPGVDMIRWSENPIPMPTPTPGPEDAAFMRGLTDTLSLGMAKVSPAVAGGLYEAIQPKSDIPPGRGRLGAMAEGIERGISERENESEALAQEAPLSSAAGKMVGGVVAAIPTAGRSLLSALPALGLQGVSRGAHESLAKGEGPAQWSERMGKGGMWESAGVIGGSVVSKVFGQIAKTLKGVASEEALRALKAGPTQVRNLEISKPITMEFPKRSREISEMLVERGIAKNPMSLRRLGVKIEEAKAIAGKAMEPLYAQADAQIPGLSLDEISAIAAKATATPGTLPGATKNLVSEIVERANTFEGTLPPNLAAAVKQWGPMGFPASGPTKVLKPSEVHDLAAKLDDVARTFESTGIPGDDTRLAGLEETAYALRKALMQKGQEVNPKLAEELWAVGNLYSQLSSARQTVFYKLVGKSSENRSMMRFGSIGERLIQALPRTGFHLGVAKMARGGVGLSDVASELSPGIGIGLVPALEE